MSFRSQSSGEETPPLEKKASLILPTQTTISSIPDDLLLNCLARVSRLYYPTLSLVSKKFRSLISSPELYEVRSVLGVTESCLYVCLWFYPDSNPRWYTLCRKPETTKKTKESSGYLLVPISFPHTSQVCPLGLVSIGSSIYTIGGLVENAPSSVVSVLDCRSHTWHQAPDMEAVRKSQAENVIDGKIYVTGGRVDKNSSWIEVFDLKSQTWNSLSSPGREICDSEDIRSIKIDEKIYMHAGDRNKGVVYNPKDGKCEPIDFQLFKALVYRSHCVIDNVVFCHRYGKRGFKWFDTETRLWRDLEGLEGISCRISRLSSVKMVDYGGKIAVFWDRDVSCCRSEGSEVIWCAVISIKRERRDSDDEEEIWGMVEWFDVVLTVPLYRFVRVLATTL